MFLPGGVCATHLARHLEVKILPEQLLFLQSGKGDLILRVILLNEVFNDGTGLPELDASVGIL